MNHLRNRWYNRLLVRFAFHRTIKKIDIKKLNKLYCELLLIKQNKKATTYQDWQVDIAISVTIKRLKKYDKR